MLYFFLIVFLGLSQHLKDPSHLALFQHNPHLKVLCKTAIVHAIKELIGFVFFFVCFILKIFRWNN